MNIPTMDIPTLEQFPLFEGNSYIFSYNSTHEEGIVPKGNVVNKRFLGITGGDPCFCKSNRLHVDIIRFSFIKLGYIL